MAERKRSCLRKIIQIQDRNGANRKDLEGTRGGITSQGSEGPPSPETVHRESMALSTPGLQGDVQGR